MDVDLRTAAVESVGRLVRVESPTHEVDACAAAVEEAIAVCGRWLTDPAVRLEHRARPILSWGSRRPRILLLGHLDTVWPLGTIDRLPWSCDGDRMTGPGVFDMKAGVVQAIVALSLAEVGASDGVGLLLTTDEETGSRDSRDLIAGAIEQAEAVLVFEPSLSGALKTERKGTSWYGLEFEGRAAHAGLDPERGINALLAAAHAAIDCAAQADPVTGTTVTPTLASAGTTANTVPAQASLTLDVRAWTAAEQQRIDDYVRAWDGGAATLAISGGIDRPPLEESMSEELFILAGAVAAGLGQAPLRPAAVGGASDGNLTAAAGVPTLDGLGAVGDGAHADHEWASIDDLIPRAALAAGLIRTLLERDRG